MLTPDNNSTYLKCKGQLNSRYDKQPATAFPLLPTRSLEQKTSGVSWVMEQGPGQFTIDARSG